MRSKWPRGTSAAEVQVSLTETSQNTISSLPPILQPTRNSSHTYNQMLQSTLSKRGEGPTASLQHGTDGVKPRSKDTTKPASSQPQELWDGDWGAAAGVGLPCSTARSFQVGLLLFMGSQTSSVISPLHLLNSNSLTMRTCSFIGHGSGAENTATAAHC